MRVSTARSLLLVPDRHLVVIALVVVVVHAFVIKTF